jgi:hypothetical protein
MNAVMCKITCGDFCDVSAKWMLGCIIPISTMYPICDALTLPSAQY